MVRTTRRATFGAIGSIAAAGFIAGHAAQAAALAPNSPDGGRWWRLFARMERAKAIYEEYDRTVHEPLHREWLARNNGCCFRDTPEKVALAEAMGLPPIEDRYERMVEIYCTLHAQLVRLPAPDAKAAHWKFNYLVGADESDECTPCWSKDYVAPIIADVRRFIGGEA